MRLKCSFREYNTVIQPEINIPTPNAMKNSIPNKINSLQL